MCTFLHATILLKCQLTYKFSKTLSDWILLQFCLWGASQMPLMLQENCFQLESLFSISFPQFVHLWILNSIFRAEIGINQAWNMLIEAWNGSIYRWHGVSLWWKCLYTPFIYTLFYTIYTFGYFTHTGYTHFLPCVLIIISILCVSYDSIHVLNVYVLSRAISSPFY